MVFCGENCENLQRKGTSPPLLQTAKHITETIEKQ